MATQPRAAANAAATPVTPGMGKKKLVDRAASMTPPVDLSGCKNNHERADAINAAIAAATSSATATPPLVETAPAASPEPVVVERNWYNRNRTLVWVVAVVIIILLIGGTSFGFFVRNDSTNSTQAMIAKANADKAAAEAEKARSEADATQAKLDLAKLEEAATAASSTPTSSAEPTVPALPPNRLDAVNWKRAIAEMAIYTDPQKKAEHDYGKNEIAVNFARLPYDQDHGNLHIWTVDAKHVGMAYKQTDYGSNLEDGKWKVINSKTKLGDRFLCLTDGRPVFKIGCLNEVNFFTPKKKSHKPPGPHRVTRHRVVHHVVHHRPPVHHRPKHCTKKHNPIGTPGTPGNPLGYH